METITREALRKKIERGDDFALVEVLPPEEYERYHLPGAINIPLGGDFDSKVERALSDKNQEIVVYCSDENCSASPTAAKKLQDLGYQRVLNYKVGKQDWLQGGERGRAPQ
jgi:rhodanese-related sulfurtransferase